MFMLIEGHPFISLLIEVYLVYAVFGGLISGWSAGNGRDDRTPEQKLMDTRISDNVTRFGSVLDALNAKARNEKPKTRF